MSENSDRSLPTPKTLALAPTLVRSLRERLKVETRPEHEALEMQMAILSPDLSKERYFEILQNLYSLHGMIEAQLAASSLELSKDYLANRRKTAFLEEDLPEPTLKRFPLELSWFDDAEQLLGALYVIEGSTLGGQVVSKGLRALHWANDRAIPVRYFSGYQSETGKMWQSFIKRLDLVAPEKNDSVVLGAKKMFQTFLEIL